MFGNPFNKSHDGASDVSASPAAGSFAGRWFTTFGTMDLEQQGDLVQGVYQQQCAIEGRIEQGRYVFTYQEPTARGEGWFTLVRPGKFKGQWKADGQSMWAPWVGRRLRPVPGQIALVVIEAHWQRHLMDKEYSFGNMLKEFFARLPGVRFTHRFFSNEDGLRQWCRDLAY